MGIPQKTKGHEISPMASFQNKKAMGFTHGPLHLARTDLGTWAYVAPNNNDAYLPDATYAAVHPLSYPFGQLNLQIIHLLFACQGKKSIPKP